MREFFRGWKRKTGVLTLVMALVGMGGWVRSHAHMDLVEFYSGTTTTTGIVSQSGSLIWETAQDKNHHDSLSVPEWSISFPSPVSTFYHGGDWRDWRWCGFGVAKIVYQESDVRGYLTASRMSCWVPYWSVVVPLTLISLWLLLSKPRPSTSKKNPEPIAKQTAQVMGGNR